MSDLVNDVLSRVAGGRRGMLTWFDRLPPDEQEQLAAVRRSFDPNVHQYRAFAKALIASAEERGIAIAGEQGVVRWLKSR